MGDGRRGLGLAEDAQYGTRDGSELDESRPSRAAQRWGWGAGSGGGEAGVRPQPYDAGVDKTPVARIALPNASMPLLEKPGRCCCEIAAGGLGRSLVRFSWQVLFPDPSTFPRHPRHPPAGIGHISSYNRCGWLGAGTRRHRGIESPAVLRPAGRHRFNIVSAPAGWALGPSAHSEIGEKKKAGDALMAVPATDKPFVRIVTYIVMRRGSIDGQTPRTGEGQRSARGLGR
jgi:hypothetical protein